MGKRLKDKKASRSGFKMVQDNHKKELEKERKCYFCSVLIQACMGYVIARDFIQLLNNPNYKVRESCGKCVERITKLDSSLSILEKMLN